MTIVDLDRTCTLVPPKGDPSRGAVSTPLSEYRTEPAYVLLGDPGAGKTTCFKRERALEGGSAKRVPARQFVGSAASPPPEWRNKTLFIDGLDEIRAGTDEGRTALDRVFRMLQLLRPSRFRLSCREADWLGRNDTNLLEAATPDGQIKVLRLDPLTLEQAKRICEVDKRVVNADQFMRKASERGLGSLVLNPQTLELLIAAVFGAGKWPKSRLETFDLACRQLASEPNIEHKYSLWTRPSEKQVLHNAGRICALLLLSGTPGVSLLPPGEADHVDFPQMEDFDPTPAGMTDGEAAALARVRRLTLASRLFAIAAGSHPAGQRFEPVHRHIAEFLAGRYLAQQVEADLPPARVIALVTAGDGGVVTAHRGLSGWLAAHSTRVRHELIERDPIGIGLYGDTSSFTTEEKRKLLLAMQQEGPRLQDLHWSSARALAPLCSEALEGEIRDKLRPKPRNDDDHYPMAFLLMLLSDAVPMPTLAGPILEILYEPAWPPSVSYWALEAFLRHCHDPDFRTGKLEQLLSDVYDGRLDDPNNRVAGAALEQLYPSVVGPGDVWRYLARTRPSNYFGAHWLFWSRLAEEQRSSDADVAVLLDTLPQHVPDLRVALDTSRLATVAGHLLVRGLNAFGSDLTQSRLYDWLSAPVECLPYADTHEIEEQQAKVAAWLQRHPDAYKLAFREGLRREDGDSPPSRVVRVTQQRLYEAEPPKDFGSWCLGEAETLAASRPALARYLFGHAQKRSKLDEDGISQQVLDECLRRHPSWRPEPEDPKAAQELQEAERRWRESQRAFEKEHEEEQRQWLDAVRREIPALHENRGAPWLLHRLAAKWFERCSSEPVPLNRWLREELGRNEDLVAAAFDGLYDAIERPDMPDLDEIARLHSKSQYHFLSKPFLASLQVRDQEDPTFLHHLTGLQQRTALALHLRVPTGLAARPAWYGRLVQRSPKLAATVLLPFARTEIRNRRSHVAGLSELAHDPHHDEVARLASVPLLHGFPVRSRASQLYDLRRLLWAGIKHADPDELRAIIEKKLAARSMTVAQKATWLGAALVVDPHAFVGLLEEFVDGSARRARQLADFLWFEFTPGTKELPPDALEALVRQFGRARLFENDLSDSHDPSLGHMGGLIDLLAAAPEYEAAEALRRLASDESLSEWRPSLLLALDRQSVVFRDASYQRPGLATVRATLNNAAPANAADLAALALDRLDQLSPSIRNSETNDWRQYWERDKQGDLTPNHENDCRDALLRQLKPRLPYGVMPPEAAAPGSRRSDIALYYRGLKLPFEAKKQSHPELWRAARDQLVAKYCQEPTTGGFGIYLVFWFGGSTKTQPDEDGRRPNGPAELQERLQATLAKQLPPEQRRKIAVRVIDVSRP